MPRWIHAVYGSIWLVTTIVFACLAISAYQSTSITLVRLAIQLDPNMRVQIMGIDFGQTLTTIAELNNRNVTVLEESVRSSAWLSFTLNAVSCLAAFFGFVAQLGQYRHDQRRTSQREEERAERQSNLREERIQTEEGDAEHEDGGKTDN